MTETTIKPCGTCNLCHYSMTDKCIEAQINQLCSEYMRKDAVTDGETLDLINLIQMLPAEEYNDRAVLVHISDIITHYNWLSR